MTAPAPRKKIRLGDLLVEKGLVTEEQLMPETLARHYRAVALKKNPDDSLFIAMADPEFSQRQMLLQFQPSP